MERTWRPPVNGHLFNYIPQNSAVTPPSSLINKSAGKILLLQRSGIFRGRYTPPHVAMESIWSPHGVHGGSMEFGGSPCGLHVDSTWTSPSYKTESFQTPWTPHGLHMESTWSLHGLLMDSLIKRRLFRESLFSPTGTPQGLHKDSARTPQGLRKDSLQKSTLYYLIRTFR